MKLGIFLAHRGRALLTTGKRAFVQNIVRKSTMMKDEDFLPELEELEIEHQTKLESTLTVHKKPDNMLKHQEEYGGILYKYDLPVENKPVIFKSQNIVPVEEPNTAVENLFETLEIDKDTAYESFIIKMN